MGGNYSISEGIEKEFICKQCLKEFMTNELYWATGEHFCPSCGSTSFIKTQADDSPEWTSLWFVPRQKNAMKKHPLQYLLALLGLFIVIGSFFLPAFFIKSARLETFVFAAVIILLPLFLLGFSLILISVESE